MGMTAVRDLRCEHLIRPLGIETPAPRLSWQLVAEARGKRQTAYRVLAATSAGLLAQGKADLWDSERAKSGASVLIPYAGRKLYSRQRCWWKVHVWDETGAETVSDASWWEMGLLSPRDWRAQWIAGQTPLSEAGVPMVYSPLFRKAFRLKKAIASARAYVCGLGFHEFYLNGQKVSNAVLHPAFTRYDARALYTFHDVTGLLASGDNVAGIMVGNGWYNHHERDVWNLQAAPWRDEPKALAQIEIVFEDGSKTVIVTNATWRWAPGPIIYDGLRRGEVYDAREEKPGWSGAGFDDSSWRPVWISRPPGGVLRAQIMPPCRVKESVPARAFCEVRPGVRVYDLGRNIAGWARLRTQGPAGTEVVMKHAERLGSDGDIDQTNISPFPNPENLQTDRYTLKGQGVETYEPRFTYHGFQYVQVTGLPGGEDAAGAIEGRVVHTDLEQTGFFECSNDLLNRIQCAVVASTLSNYHGIPTDCPQREKQGWTGDAHLSAEQVLFNFDAAAAYTKWLDDLADCQWQSGALPCVAPTGGWGYNWGSGPAWDSAYINIPWYLYVYRGDLEILRRHYQGMKRYLGFLESISTGHIVQYGLGDWCPPTRGAGSHKAPAELTNTACYHACVQTVARIARILGKAADARRYETLAGRIKASARKRFYDRKKGRVAGHSQTSIACFLYQGLCESDEVEAFGDMLRDEVAACDHHIDTGILGAKYVLGALTDMGRADIAYRIVTQKDFPGWGWWIEQGATTLWETWFGEGSLNHHMFSDVGAWFYKALAGIRPDPACPGFKRAIIHPYPARDLSRASGRIQTPHGLLRSAWRRDGRRLNLDVTIPPNSEGLVHIPSRDLSVVFESGRSVQASRGVALQGVERGRAVLSCEAGDYHFETEVSEAQ